MLFLNRCSLGEIGWAEDDDEVENKDLGAANLIYIRAENCVFNLRELLQLL